ncbi:MAG: hypothetical protein R3B46_03190 [Phycisphaerales bacterium]|nr:hypothetical protein [Phycisphaerales bacterium]
MLNQSYRNANRRVVCLAGVLFAAIALPAFGGTPTITNINTSTTYTSLQSAINGASAGETIEIGNGVLFEHDILLDKPLTIRGQGMDDTTIDGGGLGGVLSVGEAGAEMTLEDLTIAHGQLNVSTDSGGLFVQGGAELIVRRVRLLENASAIGGGVGVIGSEDPMTTLFADSCEFLGNTAGGQGGGLGIGAGHGADVTLVNCLFRGNQAVGPGGAVSCYLAGNSVTTINCTFAENTSNNTSSIVVAGFGGQIEMANCVVVGVPGTSVLDNGGATFSVQNTLLAPDVSFDSITDGGGNIFATPIFEDAVNGDYRLAAGSPGIDAADASAYTMAWGGAFDLDGDPRFHDDPGTDDTGAGVPSDLDMGAYEFQGVTVAPCPGDIDGSGSVDIDDLNALLGAWDSNVGMGDPRDLAGDDGLVDTDDLNVVLSHWNATCI